MGSLITFPPRQRSTVLPLSYVLPISAHRSQVPALSEYLHFLSGVVDDVIVVDGSSREVFETHARAWRGDVRHMRPECLTRNGKVGNVMTGVRAAQHDAVIIADDDVRYQRSELRKVLDLLQEYDVVRPQNFFRPMPWHARWDTARSLLNRLGSGDWPGTLGIRRSLLLKAGGYSGDVLFENLELVRTMLAARGRETVQRDLFVMRRPPSTAHFLSQRVRQAYDEWARPCHLGVQLSLLPLAVLAIMLGSGWLVAAGALIAIAAAEAGRRRGGGQAVFPPSSALWAPAWVAERAVTSWAAVGLSLFFGGVRYRATRLKSAATPSGELRARVQSRMVRNDRTDID